jgi:hypothetical protein
MAQELGDGVPPLESFLERIASDFPVEGIEPAVQQAGRPAARALLDRKQSLRPKALSQLNDAPELAILAAALDLRSQDLVDFWMPVLEGLKEGKSLGPLKDFKQTHAQAVAVAEAIERRPNSTKRQVVLSWAKEAVVRLEIWLPRDGPAGRRKPTRYARGAFAGEEDEDGNPVHKAQAAPPPAEVKESRGAAILGWTGVVLVIALMAGGAWFALQNMNPPKEVGWYQTFVPAVIDKRIEGRELVFVMSDAWALQPIGKQLTDARELEELARTERFKALRFDDTTGTWFLKLGADGGVTRAKPGVKPAAPAATPPPIEPEAPTTDGTLDRPLTADEIPLD